MLSAAGTIAVLVGTVLMPPAAHAEPGPPPAPKPAAEPAPPPGKAGPSPLPKDLRHETSFQLTGLNPGAAEQAAKDAAGALKDPKQEAARRQWLSGNRSFYDASKVGRISTQRERLTPPAQPDPALADECMDRGYGTTGFVKNRFEWCVNGLISDYLIDTQGRRFGFVYMNVSFVGYGRDDAVRSTVIFMRPTTVLFFGNYTPLTRVPFGLDCDEGNIGCEASADQSLTLAEWLARSLAGSWVRWEVSSDESQANGTDLVSYHRFAPWFKNIEGRKVFAGDDIGTRYSFGIRCDSAAYIFAGREKGCVFNDVLPHLQYPILNADGTSTNFRAVAEHIKQAQDDPNSTYPPRFFGNKDIPGKYTGVRDGRQLERIPETDPRVADNRRVVQTWCSTIEPPPDMIDPECDEYPFASTIQGAAHGLPWDFSVKYVPRTDNRSAGGVLPNYYRDDRILYEDRDAFWVEILGRAGDDQPTGQAPLIDAGPHVYGDEGSPIALHGSVRSRGNEGLTVQWSYEALENVDAGASCRFSDPRSLETTITCNDDGFFNAILTVTDPVHGTLTDSALVTVANVPPRIQILEPRPWDVFRVGEPIVFNVPITDAANDTHRCEYWWDDGNGWDDPFDAPFRNCGTVHGFDHAGMYTITVFVADDDGGTASESVMIIVYDPNEGSANIDGWTQTPAGALADQPAATGNTFMTYVARYPLGGTIPTGLARFWVGGTNFQLDPTGMEWFVLTEDGKVAGRGTGTVAGRSGYTWVLYGWDACGAGTTSGCVNVSQDKVRLVVFESATGRVVYDHSPGSGQYDVDMINPTNLNNGTVQVHRWPR